MKINEIFSAIQGEGPEVGTPTVFVRMSGCNLQCQFCDTRYHKDGINYSVDNVITDIFDKGKDIHHVTITGGEPTLQEWEMATVIGKLRNKGYKISVETNGTIQTGIHYDTIVISPKKQKVELKILSEYARMNNTFFKFVYEDKKNKWWEDVIRIARLPKNKIYIMPEGASRKEQIKKMPEVMEYCLKKGFKFGGRLHVLAYNKKRGV